MAWTPDTPGRGAWTLRGGLVNNSGGVVGYYQLPYDSAAPKVGQTWKDGSDTTDAAFCVHRAVREIQETLGPLLDSPTAGVWDEATQQAMLGWQEQVGLVPANGIFGPRTSALFFRPIMTRSARHKNVPWRFLFGISSRESGLDPAAVGISGWDHGLCQINLDPAVHDDISRINALSPLYAFGYTAANLRTVHDRWAGNTTADPWDVAIASHNSPALAQQWGEDGSPPYVEGRIFQIEDYVIDVRLRGESA